MSNFSHAFLKVQRANEHIQHIDWLSSHLPPSLFKVHWVDGDSIHGGMEFDGPRKDPNAIKRQLVWEPTQQIPEFFSLLIGDAIHNLRSALDYAATAVVRSAAGNTNYVTFPFHEEREKLECAQSTGLKAIKAALPQADVETFFRDVIKSYRDGNFPLWAITKLDKIDKHNALIPNVTITDMAAASLKAASPVNVTNWNVRHDSREKFAIFTGWVSPHQQVEDDFEITSQITFGEGDLFGNEAVFPTLLNLSKVTLQALERFDAFVTKTKGG